jgi:hypothetical protein
MTKPACRHFGRMGTDEVITTFWKGSPRNADRNTNLSIDIFGVVAWEHEAIS